jgi:DNA-binding transcriptional LysR family regulator
MDLHRLGLVSTRVQHFQLVARLGSIRAAARAVNLAPSSVSRSLKSLEDDLKAPLFERTQQRLRLTSAGELLLYHLKQAGAEPTRAVTVIGDLQGLRRGTVTIAVIESVARGLLPDVLAAFWVRHPEIAVSVTVAGSGDAAAMVSGGEADLALVFDVRVPRNARRLAAAMMPMGVVVPPESRLARIVPLRLSDLAGERVLLSDGSLALGASLEEAFGRSGIEVRPRARTNSIGLMIELARRGLGTLLQTRIGLERALAQGDLVFLPLVDARIAPRRLTLIGRVKSEMSEAANAMADTLARAVDRLNP